MVMDTMNAYNRRDPSSQSNSDEVTIEHIDFNWTIGFDSKNIYGTTNMRMRVLKEHASCIKLDTHDLSIESIHLNETLLSYKIEEPMGSLGNCIVINLPLDSNILDIGVNPIFQLLIKYKISPTASAVQWLDASATANKQHPFVFTQSQAIHARSLFPCMDTPGVKHTYSATITAPSWCTVLMSAISSSPPTISATHSIHTWEQTTPISSYLVALAAGLLSSHDVSDRVRIWAEPAVIDAAAYEFAETDMFLTTAEELTCPYAWKRYDILCLPPSFPYGGMENPCLTFATPTLLAGDRSLASVIAHEIAHSWTGNLVTNATWEHFWLNEGMTVWLERKILHRTRGIDAFHLSAEIGRSSLIKDVDRIGSKSLYTRLVWVLEEGADPDDAFSRVPYEKGFNLLHYLESKVGTPLFEKFIKAYIDKYKYSTVTSGDFKDYFMEYMSDKDVDKNLTISEFWDRVLYSTGLTSEFTSCDFSNPLSAAATSLATAILTHDYSNVNALLPYTTSAMEGWSTQQKCLLLDKLLRSCTTSPSCCLSEEALIDIDYFFLFSLVKNSEIRFIWQMLCLTCKAEFILPQVISFISEQGRMKFVRPLYRTLATAAPDIAHATFEKYSASYHPIARKMIAADLLAIKSTSLESKSILAITASAEPATQSDPEPRPSTVLIGTALLALALVGSFVFLRFRKF